MFLPRCLFFHSREEVEHGGVLLPVVAVDGRVSVVRQGVVEPFLGLDDARFLAVLPDVQEKVFDVAVGQLLVGRDDVGLPFGLPVEVVD